MLSILCPHCRAKLTVEKQWQGKAVNCLSCGQKLAVPVVVAEPSAPEPSSHESTAAEPVNDSPLLVTPTVTARSKRRQRPVGNRIVSVVLHLSITVATVYAGYYLINQQRPQTSQPKTVAAEQSTPRIAAKPKSKPRPSSTRMLTSEKVPSEPEASPEEPTEVAEPSVSPFLELPLIAALPPTTSTEFVALVNGLSNPEFRLLSNSSALTQQDGELVWNDVESGNPSAIATLTLDDGTLSFRWSETVPPAAEAAARNSIVRLSDGEHQHVLCLRDPEIAEPLQIDLAKSQQKIIGKCDHLPNAADICFELLNLDELPASTVDGTDPTQLQFREQTTLEYMEAAGAATRLSMNKQGNVAVVVVASGYKLPSGDEQPMSISRGNSKIKQLTSLYQETLAAKGAIADLRSQLKNLQRDAKAVPRSRATATAKAFRLRQLQASIFATQQKIGYAERLLAQQAAIEADYQTVQQVAKLAQQLHETKLTYRFFTVVDGHPVDLLIAK